MDDVYHYRIVNGSLLIDGPDNEMIDKLYSIVVDNPQYEELDLIIDASLKIKSIINIKTNVEFSIMELHNFIRNAPKEFSI